MLRKRNKAAILALCGALVWAACGDDDDSAPTEPEPEPTPELTPEIVALSGTLVASFRDAFAVALISDEAEVPGTGGGTLTIAGNTWTLQDYSPDGALIINGTLDVAKDQFPQVPVVGTVETTGSSENTIALDIVVDASGAELVTTGTITIDGAAFDIAEIVAAAEAAAAGG